MLIECICKHCGKKFKLQSWWIKRGRGKYCSVQCHLAELNKNQETREKAKLHRKILRGKDSCSYKHGETKTRLYQIWNMMRQRCENPKQHAFNDYGGRGIKVCCEWKDFETFRDWALSNNYNDNLTIDRINNDGNYCPENCRWTTIAKQARNRRSNRFITYKGETHCINEWCEKLKIKRYVLGNLLYQKHLSEQEAFEELEKRGILC